MTRTKMINELAQLLADSRTRGNVYMDGSHNPLPSEILKATRFYDDFVLPKLNDAYQHGKHGDLYYD